jgi:hypothetical protein
MWGWYDEDGSPAGIAAVVAYLDSIDLSKFDATKAPPPKTPAF